MNWGKWLGTALGTAAGSLIPIPGVGSKIGGIAGGFLGGKAGGLFGGGGGGGGGGTPAFLADPINAVSSQLDGMNQGQDQVPMSPGNMNPYLDALYQRSAAPINRAFTDQAIPGINSSFADAGGIGGSAHALAIGDASGRHSDALAGLSAGLYGGNFEAERARQFAGEQAGLQRDLISGSAGYQGKQASQGWGDWLRQNLLPGLIEGGGTAFNTWLGGRGAGNPGGLPNIGAGTGPVVPTIPSFLRR